MKKQTENKQSEKQESSEKSQPSQLPSGATVTNSSVKEKIKVFNVGNSLSVAHVDKTKARNINAISATTNSPNRAPLITSSPATQPSSSVSHTNVGGDLSVSSHMETNQPTATASGNTVSGDLNMQVIGKYEEHIHQTPSPEEKRIVSQQKLEDALQQLRTHRLKDEAVQAELATYVSVQGGQSFEDTELLDVATKVKEFLRSEKKVLLLLGDSGMGKSIFGERLERDLWQDYNANQPIPLFIPLISVQDPLKNVIEEHLLQLGFKPQQIAQLKRNYSFVIMLDGYDEIAHHKPDNLYVSNQLASWNAKVVITCRSQYLLAKKEMYRNRFLPICKDQPEPGLYQEIVLKPFTPAQIETYLKKFVEVEKPIWKDWQVYQKHIEIIPDLKGMIETPFLLRIAVEVLPDIVKRFEDKKDTQRTALMRVNLYDAFAQRWFERQEYRLKKQGELTDPEWDIKSDFWEFSQKLATKMFQKGINEIVLETKSVRRFGQKSAQQPTNEWEEFFGNDETLRLIRSGCPLKKIGDNCYTFIHKSLLEYFGARQVFDQVAALQVSQAKTTSKKTAEKIALPSTTLVSLDINQKLLNDEPSMILFIADLVKKDETIKKLLFALIEQSKTQAEVKVAAANAMTILKVANVTFSGMDFFLIKIPGADLSGGVFDHTNFSLADLRGVNFDHAWLRGTNASYSDLHGIKLGQRPYLKPHGPFLSSYAHLIYAIAYSRDGRYLAVASNRDIVLWDRVKVKEMRTLRGHTDKVWSVAFSPDGKTVLSGSEDCTVRLWEVRNGRSRILSGHTFVVRSVAFSPDGQTVASGSWDETVRLWEVQSGQLRTTLSGYAGMMVQSVAFSPDGQTVASGSSDNTVRLWDVQSGRSRTLNGHAGEVQSVAFSPDGQMVVSGSSDETVRLWDVQSGRSRTLNGHTDKVESIAFSPDGQMIVSGSWDRTVRLWDVQSGQSRTLNGHAGEVRSVAFSLDGQTVASGSNDNSVRLWDVQSGQSRTLSGHTDGVLSVAFSPDGRTVASGSRDETMRLWEVQSGQSRTLSENTEGGGIRSITSPGREKVASADDALKLFFKNILGYYSYGVTFSPDGQTVALVKIGNFKWRTKGTIELWEVKSGQSRMLSGHSGEVWSVAFSSDGQTLASGSTDMTVRLWDVRSGQCVTVLQGYLGAVTSVCFKSADALATGSADSAVKLWRKVPIPKGDIWQLQWSSHVSLNCEDMLIEGAQGLSAEQQKLLEQQGAKGIPHMQSKLEDDNNSKNSYSPMWQKPEKQEQAQEESEENQGERSSEEDEDKHSESLNKFP